MTQPLPSIQELNQHPNPEEHGNTYAAVLARSIGGVSYSAQGRLIELLQDVPDRALLPTLVALPQEVVGTSEEFNYPLGQAPVQTFARALATLIESDSSDVGPTGDPDRDQKWAEARNIVSLGKVVIQKLVSRGRNGRLALEEARFNSRLSAAEQRIIGSVADTNLFKQQIDAWLLGRDSSVRSTLDSPQAVQSVRYDLIGMGLEENKFVAQIQRDKHSQPTAVDQRAMQQEFDRLAAQDAGRQDRLHNIETLATDLATARPEDIVVAVTRTLRQYSARSSMQQLRDIVLLQHDYEQAATLPSQDLRAFITNGLKDVVSQGEQTVARTRLLRDDCPTAFNNMTRAADLFLAILLSFDLTLADQAATAASTAWRAARTTIENAAYHALLTPSLRNFILDETTQK